MVLKKNDFLINCPFLKIVIIEHNFYSHNMKLSLSCVSHLKTNKERTNQLQNIHFNLRKVDNELYKTGKEKLLKMRVCSFTAS